jgi:hypothetical protein
VKTSDLDVRLGRLAYEGFANRLSWRQLAWDSLSSEERLAWRDAARAVRVAVQASDIHPEPPPSSGDTQDTGDDDPDGAA